MQRIVTSGTNIFIHDVTMKNISATCASNPASHYDDSGVSIGGNNTYVLRTKLSSGALANPACTLSPRWDSPGLGVLTARNRRFPSR